EALALRKPTDELVATLNGVVVLLNASRDVVGGEVDTAIEACHGLKTHLGEFATTLVTNTGNAATALQTDAQALAAGATAIGADVDFTRTTYKTTTDQIQRSEEDSIQTITHEVGVMQQAITRAMGGLGKVATGAIGD